LLAACLGTVISLGVCGRVSQENLVGPEDQNGERRGEGNTNLAGGNKVGFCRVVKAVKLPVFRGRDVYFLVLTTVVSDLFGSGAWRDVLISGLKGKELDRDIAE
jgi:hypothetical protein